jgi:DtxR family Mn-dependent transcriptional regulator
MVKALAESGLAKYEPYVGVRLTTAGEKLASLVLRRHRLIELFLVKVIGMSWAEVHDEAEQLEHAVSERLIERIDDMLGRPEVDPHGDPIPSATGAISRPKHLDLLSAPLRTPLIVTRVIDQGAGFLRFAEQHDLTPGSAIVISARDAGSDAVRFQSTAGRQTTIGTAAASKVLVRMG